MATSATVTLAYNNTDFTRKYTIEGLSAAVMEDDGITSAVQAINASLAGGTSDGLDTFFLADDYDANEGIGTLKEIIDVQINSTDSETII